MTRVPPPLQSGACVALVAPAGPLRGDEELERAIANVRAFAWEPVVGENVLARDGYFAGGDLVRASDLNRALADDEIDGIWCLRGGYGAMRILDEIDFDALGRRPKTIIGFSDITALHCAVRARCDLVSYHGPSARSELSGFTRESLRRAVAGREDPCGSANGARVLRPGAATGRVAGGNLALLAALVGTPYAPRFEDAIVVLEDVNEPVYRIDRMLWQLRLAGVFERCRAIVFGQCTDCAEEADDGARSLDAVLLETADALGVPCLAGVPVGHVADQWTMPLGAVAALDTDALRLTILPEQMAA